MISTVTDIWICCTLWSSSAQLYSSLSKLILVLSPQATFCEVVEWIWWKIWKDFNSWTYCILRSTDSIKSLMACPNKNETAVLRSGSLDGWLIDVGINFRRESNILASAKYFFPGAAKTSHGETFSLQSFPCYSQTSS